MERKNTEFEFRGINHLALVCRDMERTVDFYCNVLGMPLIKTIELPNNMGQHFFFDIGNGDSLAFFWFPNAPEAAPRSPGRSSGILRRRSSPTCWISTASRGNTSPGLSPSPGTRTET